MSQKFSAAAYRARSVEDVFLTQPEEVTLPSGFAFFLRRLNKQFFIKNGRIPESLLKIGLEVWGNSGKVSEDTLKAATAEDTLKALCFMRDAVRLACHSPRIVEKPIADDEIAPSELSEADFDFIFAYSVSMEGGEAAALASFRPGR